MTQNIDVFLWGLGNRRALTWAAQTTGNWSLGGRFFLAFGFNLSISLLLVFVAAASVVYWSPEAGGSGVPEVMAFLNGINIPKVCAPPPAVLFLGVL